MIKIDLPWDFIKLFDGAVNHWDLWMSRAQVKVCIRFI